MFQMLGRPAKRRESEGSTEPEPLEPGSRHCSLLLEYAALPRRLSREYGTSVKGMAHDA